MRKSFAKNPWAVKTAVALLALMILLFPAAILMNTLPGCALEMPAVGDGMVESRATALTAAILPKISLEFILAALNAAPLALVDHSAACESVKELFKWCTYFRQNDLIFNFPLLTYRQSFSERTSEGQGLIVLFHPLFHSQHLVPS